MKTSLLVRFSLAAVLLAGCQHTYQEIPLSQSGTHVRLQSAGIAYVAIPQDAHARKEPVLNSGLATAQIIRDAFAEHLKRAYIGRIPENRDDALLMARHFGCTYLIYPTILRWEDHSTENTGLRDKLEVKIEIIDPTSNQVLHASVLKGTSRWMTDGGDTPKDLLPEPVKKFAASLFQPLYVPSGLK